jgi:SAM-dependent methyltransferase
MIKGDLFGKQVLQYVSARKEFPKPVFDYLWSIIDKDDCFIIDLGCGTGISTRVLAKQAKVVGVDIDRVMLAEATKEDTANAWYAYAKVKSLPFIKESFDVATAFSSFHWFTSEEELQEIKRLIKPGGLFFTANKYDIGDFRDGYRKVLSQFSSNLPPSAKSNFDPNDIMSKAGFRDIIQQEFTGHEDFSLQKAVSYVQSTIVWNDVPANMQSAATEALTNHFAAKLIDNKVTRELIIRVVVGKK